MLGHGSDRDAMIGTKRASAERMQSSKCASAGGAHPQRTTLAHWSKRLAVVLLAPVVLALACGDDERPGLTGGSGTKNQTAPERCATPNEGCECEREGASVDCGRVEEEHGDYVTCSMGTRWCTGGKWTACTPERVTLKSIQPREQPRLKMQALGSARKCGPDFDPCDPYCNETTDTPDDLDAGPNFTNDGGLTLVPTEIASCDISISASTTQVTVTSLSAPLAPPVTFVLTATGAGCPPSPFPTLWTIDKVDRAAITGTNNQDGVMTIAAPIAGPVQVTAFALGLTASISVYVKVNILDAPTTAAMAAPNTVATAAQRTAFGTWNNPPAGTAASSVTWLYPYENTFFPLALPAPVIQYWYTNTGGSGTSASLSDRAVKVSLRYPANTSSNPSAANYSDFNYSLVVRESNVVSQSVGLAVDSRNPQVVIPAAAWRSFELTARGNYADLLIQRYRGGTLEQESRRRIYFVDGQLKGTVYYNSYTSPLGGNTGAVLRIAPGATQPELAVQPTASNGTRRCTACHTVNLDGSRLIVNGQRPSGGVTFNNARRYDMTNPSTFPQPPVLNSYDSTDTDDNPDYNLQGDRFTFGGPWVDGSLYMSHGGDPAFGGDRNWRAPPAYSNLYRPGDAAPIQPIPVMGWTEISAVTPRFSPDGTKLAFGFWGKSGSTLPRSPSGTLAADTNGRTIAVVDFTCSNPPCNANSTGWRVSNARNVTPNVTSGINSTNGTLKVAWPSFTPSGDAVVYQRQYRSSRSAPAGVLNGNWSPSDINTVAGALAEIWMSNVPPNGSTAATPTRLLALNGLNASGTSYLPEDNRTVASLGTAYHRNAGTSFTITQADSCSNTGNATNVVDYRLNYLPAVNPTEAGGYVWVVFTSRRMYGNIATNDPWDAEPNYPSCYSGQPPTKKLWVAAINRNWTPGTDPSHPAFYLPGQELSAGNSDGYWVNSPCVGIDGACSSNDDCCGGTGPSATVACKVTSTATVPPAQHCKALTSCSLAGEACSVTADCCPGFTCPSGGGVCVNVPPPVFEQQSLEREYTANCPSGTKVQWRFFEWQAEIPTGTSIDFFVQTKETEASTYLPASPLFLSTASSTTMPNTWARGPNTVTEVLSNASPPLPAHPYLRVRMTFNPTPTLAPKLLAWRQVFDCVPAE